MSLPEVTDDEYSLLLIMREGQSVAAIGRWEKSIESLVSRGLVRQLDKFNNIITTEGRKACGTREAADDAALKQLVPQIGKAQSDARSHVEAAAQHLARAALIAQQMTGDDPNTALLSWNIECLKRARELLRD